MTLPQLEQRLGRWLAGQYEAALFEQGTQIVAYALYKSENEYIYLRQFFVARDYRRRGLGRQALMILTTEVWPAHLPVRIEVLVGNKVARQFWQALGFTDYAVTMER
jgi:GNAT superfamily N-acetyltransferase